MSAMRAMRALVTNDDGIGSDGLRWLAATARDFGLDPVVAAPVRDSSGTSASLTAVEADGRIVVERQPAMGDGKTPAYGVAAVPGFITMIATRGAFGPPPEIVLSGINLGLNTGNAVLHSGTVGAAMTARTYGCRALAVSIDIGEPLHWETAAAVARQALRWLVELDDPVVLNVNVPNVPQANLRGIRQGTLAAFGTVQTTLAEVGEGFVRLGVVDVDGPREAGTDAALVADGYASVTALNPLCVAPDVVLPVTTNRECGRNDDRGSTLHRAGDNQLGERVRRGTSAGARSTDDGRRRF
jgi:5'-nucleotidase